MAEIKKEEYEIALKVIESIAFPIQEKFTTLWNEKFRYGNYCPSSDEQAEFDWLEKQLDYYHFILSVLHGKSCIPFDLHKTKQDIADDEAHAEITLELEENED